MVPVQLFAFFCAILTGGVHSQGIPSLIKDAYRNRMKEAISSCTQQGGITTDEFKSATIAGKVSSEWGCIYKCIMENSPIPMMNENGEITLPFFAPEETRNCVADGTSGVTDSCEKAYRSTMCWVQTRKIIKQRLGLNPDQPIIQL